MDINKILEYQKKDFELIKLQRLLDNNEDKKIYNQMISVARDAQNKSTALEKEAGQVLGEFEQLKATYENNTNSASKISNKNLDNSSDEDVSSVLDISNNIFSNLNLIEKKLLVLAERVNAVLSNFEITKKKYNEAKAKHKYHKDKYEQEVANIEPQIKKIEQELKVLEKQVPAELLTRYKQRRQDKIYPVFVAMTDKACGGCRMELPSASMEMLKQKGFLECEHCRRIIYFI